MDIGCGGDGICCGPQVFAELLYGCGNGVALFSGGNHRLVYSRPQVIAELVYGCDNGVALFSGGGSHRIVYSLHYRSNCDDDGL